ncbi:MAG: hypothetical protein U0441_35900 [Polyangiaceae bacterium]
MRVRVLASVLLLAAAALFVGPARAAGPSPNDAKGATRPPDAPGDAKRELPPQPEGYSEIPFDGIRFVYNSSTRERIRPLWGRVGAIRSALRDLVGTITVLENVDVRVAALQEEMRTLAPGDVPERATCLAFTDVALPEAPGVPVLQRPLVVISVADSSSAPVDVESALTHGLAHIALDQALNGASVPAWFHEGFAFEAADGDEVATKRMLVDAAVVGRFYKLDTLKEAALSDDLGAAQAGDFVRFLASSRAASSSRTALAQVLLRLRKGEPLDAAVTAEMGAADLATVEARWSEDRARRYAFVPVLLALLAGAAIVAAGWVAVGRSRRTKIATLAAASRARKERREAISKPARAPAKVAAAARVVAGRGRDAAIHVPRDPDVPKVEHNGEWHTLH